MTTNGPTPIDIREPVDGIRVIRLPLPFELSHVNVGLVSLDQGYMLVDTGMATADSLDTLTRSLDSLGLDWPDIRQIFITHMHPDHIGQLPKIRELTGAPILMHKTEAKYVNAMVAAGRPRHIEPGLRIAGSPETMLVAIDQALTHLSRALHHVDPDVELLGGEHIPTALGPAQVIWTPGHSVGHVCLYWPSKRVLYSGDHMIERITPNIPWSPGEDCLADYIASLEMLVPYGIDVVLPSHGRPFQGHADWVSQTKAHHATRCNELLSRLDAPRTAHELVPALWSRELSAFHYHFAIFEVLAHLEYMRRQSRIVSRASETGALLWSAA